MRIDSNHYHSLNNIQINSIISQSESLSVRTCLDWSDFSHPDQLHIRWTGFDWTKFWWIETPASEMNKKLSWSFVPVYTKPECTGLLASKTTENNWLKRSGAFINCTALIICVNMCLPNIDYRQLPSVGAENHSERGNREEPINQFLLRLNKFN